VTNLRELIYKSGNAGITQASVSLVFDNSDKSKSPDGYTDFNDLTITRQIKDDKSKYYLNGVVKTVANVKFLFKSIGLDIDNYFRFLMQQGTITKIVSFKSTDIFR
jgi:structural maintenance of chromosome 2